MHVATMPDLECLAHLGYIEHLRWLTPRGDLLSLEFGKQLRGHTALEAVRSSPAAEVDTSSLKVAQRLFEDDKRVTHRYTASRRPVLWWSRSARVLAVFPFDRIEHAKKTEIDGHPGDVLYDVAEQPGNEYLRGREFEVLEVHKLYESWHFRNSKEVGRLDDCDAQRAWPMERVGRCYSIMYSSSKRLPSRSMRGRHLHHHEYSGERYEDIVSFSTHRRGEIPRAIAVRGPRLDVESRGIVY